jgi:hypothetical protein
MAIYFLDSSALVKRYIRETGSVWVLGLFDPALKNEVFIAAIASVEIIAAITRRSRSGSISIKDATVTRNLFKSDLQKDYQIIGNWRKDPWILCNQALPKLQLQSIFRAWVDKCFVRIVDDQLGDLAWTEARQLATSTDFDALWSQSTSVIRRNPAAIAEALIGQ